MSNFVKSILDGVDAFLAWLDTSLKTTTESYCDLETAEDIHNLVTHDGSLISIIKIDGVNHLLGTAEFGTLHERISLAFQTNMKRPGQAFQFLFSYDWDGVKEQITEMLSPAVQTAKQLNLQLDDLFQERINYLSDFCGSEQLYLALWTRPFSLTKEQQKRAMNEKIKLLREKKIPPYKNAQNIFAGFKDLRDSHNALTIAVANDFSSMGIRVQLLEVHEAVHAMRGIVDPDFTDRHWNAILPGDKIPVRELKDTLGDFSELQWPPLSSQILPRCAENIDLKTCRIGDRLYASIFIELFPQEIKPFLHLFNRILSMRLPWRISYFVESGGMETLKIKSAISSLLSFASSQNRLLNQAKDMLVYTEVNTDDAVVRLKVSLSTWALVGEERLLRIRVSELARAVEGWGTCEVSEICGDPFAGVVSTMLGVSAHNVSPASVAPLSDVIYMLPFTRPSSPWKDGAVLLRSPDGKVWPYQPGSAQQTTWIDLYYARPGSGKSVLSNTINLGLCLSPGIKKLPHIAIIDIGPSSNGLISLLQEALPVEQRHQVAYHRLRMLPEFSINPFDTQLGSRNPAPQERAFLVNFLTLLATPFGATKPYDGISDMSGLVVDEVYKQFSDTGNPRIYTSGIEALVDGILEEIEFVRDEHTTWWEVTDALFVAGFAHEAMLAQRYAVPLLADIAAICRIQAIDDLYGKVMAPTGESLTQTFGRMISSAVREYSILSRATQFDLGEARVVALDLDEVAKSGGDAADRQTAVMYMLARYVLARHYYLTKENIKDMPEQYQNYHHDRIIEISQDFKRLVYDEFHRTSKSQAIRDQVIIDMREGRKWNVQIALISQSLEDFDPIMVEFATSIFIMDAGPAQAIKKSAEVFGLSETAQTALRTRVHGPREGGATFLAQFATKQGMNTQLLTSTIGPIELWAFSTTAEDVAIRNRLYQHIGHSEARRVLANIFQNGSAKQEIERRLIRVKEEKGFLEEESSLSVIDQMVKDILTEYSQNPNFKHLP